jgi:hypothetical protein
MELLQEFRGKTKSQKLIDDCYKIYKENFTKEFPEYFTKTHSKACSIVTALKENEIKNIGISKVDDLLLDNWGNFFGALMGGASAGMVSTLGSAETVHTFGSDIGRRFNIVNIGALGTLVQVGTGTTPATRQDFKTETLVQTLTSGNGGWNSGLGKIDIPASGVSTSIFSISETTLQGQWVENFQNVRNFLLARDNISPVVPVLIGQTINVDYQMLLS